MRNALLLLLALPLALPHSRAAESAAWRLSDTTAQFRVGWDTNPIGSHGTSAALLGHKETLTTALSAGFSLHRSDNLHTLKLSYGAEHQRFAEWSDEDFTTHRFGASGQLTAGGWKTTWDGSSLFIAGAEHTLLSVGAANANAVAMWRERRRQWQHRLKAQTQATFDRAVVRGIATLLDYDYRTRVVATDVPFADRTDMQAGVDLGWRQSSTSLWLAGVRTGRQIQAIVPLPNCEFDYSNRYERFALGWEGALSPRVSLSLLAGPDFRHYDGQIDPRVFSNRDRTSLWAEGNFTAKPTASVTLTGRLSRFEWLSSTGKSAYRDSCAELGASWNVRPEWTLRGNAKVHRCDYYPAARDDWEAFFSAGLSRPLSRHATLTFDLTRHRAWNNLDAFAERSFGRWIFSTALTWRN